MPKRIGRLFGMDDTFPWALTDAINNWACDATTPGIEEESWVRSRSSRVEVPAGDRLQELPVLTADVLDELGSRCEAYYANGIIRRLLPCKS